MENEVKSIQALAYNGAHIVDRFCDTCHEEFPPVLEKISYFTRTSI